ncbi:hypothetical protein [Streptomyces griseus]|uniref:hypothetical protein n=1 Tax=Streptomyces griseus TaxID=1911 RepID=UPI000564F0AD|nr:hypothetical protein [Streptomyces griseus]
MTEHRVEGPGQSDGPVPRDLPDQQAQGGEDPWEGDPARAQADAETEDPDNAPRSEDVPDTDEAGTGRQGAPHGATVHPEHPVPDEPSA